MQAFFVLILGMIPHMQAFFVLILGMIPHMQAFFVLISSPVDHDGKMLHAYDEMSDVSFASQPGGGLID